MVQSAATTVARYLAELPKEKRDVVAAVRTVIRKKLPRGYREAMGWGMITYTIPLEKYPETYNGQPLCYAALAAQKNYFALYLMCAYGDPGDAKKLREGFRNAGKTLDMGKSCVRFRRLEDLPLQVIGELIAATPPDVFIARYEAARAGREGKRNASR